ncbi:hypothetical protein C6497_07840 [Candidatus Poribacteria bacterium]|nr:MAG: hypothetical protein C6497_07840 [Candidatus Poribacteria bacterium]
MDLIGIWVAAFLTLCIYSFLYRDNPLYRFAEHLFVGISVGYGIVLSIHQGFLPLAWKPFWEAITFKDPSGLWVIIPIAFGLLFFARLSPKHTWLIRYPIAVLIGYGSGIAIPNVLRANIFEQTRGTLQPFGKMTETIAANGDTIPALSTFEIFGAILMVIGVICTLTYFFFSVEHRGPIKGLSKVGIAFLMIGFGSAFGNTVMGRVALLIQRVDFLMFDWIASFGTIFNSIF